MRLRFRRHTHRKSVDIYEPTYLRYQGKSFCASSKNKTKLLFLLQVPLSLLCIDSTSPIRGSNKSKRMQKATIIFLGYFRHSGGGDSIIIRHRARAEGQTNTVHNAHSVLTYSACCAVPIFVHLRAKIKRPSRFVFSHYATPVAKIPSYRYNNYKKSPRLFLRY